MGPGRPPFWTESPGPTPARGTVLLKGEDISTLSAHGRARLGLRRTWQSVELFEDLTVAENLAVSADSPTLTSGFVDLVKPRKIELRARALEALSMFGFEKFADEMPYPLSLGHQKLGVWPEHSCRGPVSLASTSRRPDSTGTSHESSADTFDRSRTWGLRSC